MCGIWCCISTSGDGVCPACTADDEKSDRMRLFLSNRGPDASSSSCISVDKSISPNQSEGSADETSSAAKNHRNIEKIHFSGHVLWTQGPKPIRQPYVNADETKFLLFNGDIYSFNGTYEEYGTNGVDDFHPEEKNDGLVLFEKFQNASDSPEYLDEFIETISNLRGPFAFVYFDKRRNKIWFGRDFFGRESLLFSFRDDNPNNGAWNISSISVFDKVYEIPTAGLYEFDIAKAEVSLVPYSCHGRQNVLDNVQEFSKFLSSVGVTSAFNPTPPTKSINLSFCTKLKSSSCESSDVLRNLTHLASQDSLTPSDVLISATKILDPYVVKFIDVLKQSVRLRLKAISPLCRNEQGCLVNQNKVCDNNRVGVLFSGGLDSTVLAYLAAEETGYATLELINVAFSKTDNYENIPDRETALESFRVLKNILPQTNRKRIRLVLVNGRKDEVEEMRRERVKTLISPLKSVLDDSVGCCLWFASRGHGFVGFVHEDDNERNSFEGKLESSIIYNSTVRTVLLGSGADELLGGYSRHRSAFERGGWPLLDSEMQFDLDRISIRNLGRDNRVVSDNKICPRMPFLDEGVVDFLTQECDLWVKCCPLLGNRGLGEKLLLRASAVKLFGEENVHIAMFPKRAMQFGSRIAKLENSREKGGDDCNRLK